MLRLSRALAAVILAVVGATGCAQCDTCDDFPIPCAGGNCGFEGPPPPGAYNVVATGPGTTMVAPDGFTPPMATTPVIGAPVISPPPPPPPTVSSAPATTP
jgi:hypothetical protein